MVQRSVAAIDLRLFWCRGSGQSGCRRRRRPQSVGAGARLPTDATLGDRGAAQPVRACLCAGDPAVAPGISARLVTACVVRKIDACDLHRITAADRESVARERATRPPDPSGIEGLPARTESLLPCRAALHPALGRGRHRVLGRERGSGASHCRMSDTALASIQGARGGRGRLAPIRPNGLNLRPPVKHSPEVPCRYPGAAIGSVECPRPTPVPVFC